MSVQESLLRDLAEAIAKKMRERVAEGKGSLPPWRPERMRKPGRERDVNLHEHAPASPARTAAQGTSSGSAASRPAPQRCATQCRCRTG